MNQSPGLLERLSPRPMVCPLVRLGRISPTEEPTQSQTYYNYNYKYHSKESLDNSETNYPYYESFINNEPGTSQKSVDLSLGTSYWEQDNSSPEYFRFAPQTQETNYLLDNFAKLGKSSPSLDQGYHTLVSPSPGPITSNVWSESNMYKGRCINKCNLLVYCNLQSIGKKHQMKNNSFDQLPDEVVVKIFSFLKSMDLSVCAKVCRRFEILAWTPLLWRTIQLEGEGISGDKAIRGVLRQLCGQGRTGTCPSVERIHLTGGCKISDKGLLLLAKRCPELTHLQIHGSVTVTNAALTEVTTRCTNLQHLDVTGSHSKSHFTKFIISILLGCVNISCISAISGPESPSRLQLQYLDLTDCIALQDNGLRIVVRNCPQLAYLYLRRCIQITGMYA